MAKKTKKQSQRAEQDDGRVFMQRLQKNLEFFQKRRPGLYKLLANMELQSVELVVTPGKNDVDMVANGVSCYRGLAREYSVDEATRVLKENPESKRILTYAPPWERSYNKENFADHILRNIVKASPVTPATFKGYIRGNVFPSMVFLGCGLGYHIDELTKKVPIINGIVIEREPEKFAVSLYTVDWEEICSRFSRRGFSLTFAIGKANHPDEIRRLVRQYMTRDVPFYPFFSTYYNHLADVDLAKAVLENANDLAVITTNWSHYDNELMRLSNAVHNIRRGGRYLPRLDGLKQDKPLVIVGSGPSLDARVQSLITVRDKVVVVSCGTSLKPLLAHGVRPDVHVELDPSYRLHELHQDIGEYKLRDLPLLAVSEVNPFVTTLFRKVFYYFKFDNAQCSLVGVKDKAFANCNPTVTNAALSIGHGLGFRKIFLFGTDYGFESVEKDHSAKSIYGSDSDSGLSKEYQERALRENKQRKIFSVPSVTGGTVLTRNDYYTAKRSVEDLIVNLKSTETPPQIFNCGDGAVIEGTNWLDDASFFREMEQVQQSDVFVLEDFLDQLSEELATDSIDDLLGGVHSEIQKLCNGYERMLRTARLNGRRDLCKLINEIRESLAVLRPHAGEASVTGVQVMAFQLLKGTLQHFMYVGLCHGMACEDDELVDFVKAWKGGFEEFLGMVPRHFHKVLVLRRAIEADPWAKRHKGDRDPEYAPGQTLSVS